MFSNRLRRPAEYRFDIGVEFVSQCESPRAVLDGATRPSSDEKGTVDLGLPLIEGPAVRRRRNGLTDADARRSPYQPPAEDVPFVLARPLELTRFGGHLLERGPAYQSVSTDTSVALADILKRECAAGSARGLIARLWALDEPVIRWDRRLGPQVAPIAGYVCAHSSPAEYAPSVARQAGADVTPAPPQAGYEGVRGPSRLARYAFSA
jgi:hypothetical protein